MWCAHEKPSFYLFSDVIFFSCVFFFQIRFKNKVRFSSRFALALENHPRFFRSHFSFAILLRSHFLCTLQYLFASHSFSRAHSLALSVSRLVTHPIPFYIHLVCVFCVSRTLIPPMSTHATSEYILHFPCWLSMLLVAAHIQKLC